MRFKNTLKKGSVRYIVFKDQGTWYAVGLEFNIVESGDDPREVLLLLFEAIEGYIRSVKKIGARPYILNQRTDPEYERMWSKLEVQPDSSTVSGMPLFTFGEHSLAAVKV